MAAPVYVQDILRNEVRTKNHSFGVPSVTNGNLLVFTILADAPQRGAPTSFTDTQGNSWASGIVSESANNFSVRIYYAVASATGALTINWGYSGLEKVSAQFLEFSGQDPVSPFDVAGATSGSVGGATIAYCAAAPGITTQTDVVVIYAAQAGAAFSTFTEPSGSILVLDPASDDTGEKFVSYRTSSSALIDHRGDFLAANSTTLRSACIAFKAAGGSPPALVAGTASLVSEGDTIASVTATDATGGTTPYTYQWQRSTTSGSGFSNVSGATSLTLNDTGLANGTTYYYQLVYTDDAAATVTSNEVSATPVAVPSGTGSFAAVGTLAGAGETQSKGSGSFSAVGAIAGAGKTQPKGSGSFSAVGTLAGAGTAPVVGGASGSGIVEAIDEISGAGSVPEIDPALGSGSFLAIGSLSGSGQVTKTGGGDISSVPVISGNGIAPSITGVQGHGSFGAIAILAGAGSAKAAGFGEITGAASVVGAGESPRAGTGEISAVGTLEGSGSSPSISDALGSGSFSSQGTIEGAGKIKATGSGLLSAVDAAIAAGSTIMSGFGSIDAIGSLTGEGINGENRVRMICVESTSVIVAEATITIICA